MPANAPRVAAGVWTRPCLGHGFPFLSEEPLPCLAGFPDPDPRRRGDGMRQRRRPALIHHKAVRPRGVGWLRRRLLAGMRIGLGARKQTTPSSRQPSSNTHARLVAGRACGSMKMRPGGSSSSWSWASTTATGGPGWWGGVSRRHDRRDEQCSSSVPRSGPARASELRPRPPAPAAEEWRIET